MGRNPKIKLTVKSDKELDKLVDCHSCGEKDRYGSMYFYIDESNIAITNNSKPICKHCKHEKNNRKK